jgi:hypothetical protein
VGTHDGVTNVAVIDGMIRIYEQKDNGERLAPPVETPEGYQRGPAYLGMGDISRLEDLLRTSKDQRGAARSWGARLD